MGPQAEGDAAAGVVLIAGPTASGKSRLAVQLAAERHGVIVNADSMQVYRDLRIVNARPSAADEAVAPHLLYGHVGAETRYSVGAWLADMEVTLAAIRSDGRVAIVVGGTGLYFKALTEGLASIPPIEAALRSRILAEAADAAPEALHGRLDPEDAAAIRPSDTSRIVRALEVFAATGRSLVAWKRTAAAPPLVNPATAERIVVMPERAELHRRIGVRAEAMVHSGAIEEASALAALGLSPAMPAMKAIGVRQLIDHIAGKISLDEAIASMKTETRRYAKRQMTWIRNQMGDWPVTAG